MFAKNRCINTNTGQTKLAERKGGSLEIITRKRQRKTNKKERGICLDKQNQFKYDAKMPKILYV